VVSLHAAGVDYAVASLGTALTVEQARLIKRYCTSAYLGYDGDSAGQNAMNRGGDILRAEGIDTRVVTFPDGMDPDDFARAKGIAGISALLEQAQPLNDYFLAVLAAQYDLNTTAGRAKYVSRCCADVLKKIDSPVERDGYIRQLALRSGISATAIAEELSRMGAAPAAQETARYENKPAATQAPAQPTPGSRAAAAAEETLLIMALQSAHMRIQLQQNASAEDFTAPALAELAALLLGDAERITPENLHMHASPETCAEVSRLLITGDDAAHTPQVFNDCIKEIQMRRVESRILAINDELKKNGTNNEHRVALKKEMAALQVRKAALSRDRGS